MMRHVAANALTLLILGLVVVFGIVTWAQSQYRERGPLTAPLDVRRSSAARGWRASPTKLAAAGAISNATVFRIAARYTDLEAGLRFGEYSIPAGASMEEILELLNRGGNVVRQVVVPEGLTSWQVVELLQGARGADRRDRGDAARGDAGAGGVRLPARRRPGRTCWRGWRRSRRRSWRRPGPARAPDLPLRVAGGAADAGLDRREGDRGGGGAGAGRRRSSSTGCGGACGCRPTRR